MFVHAQENFVGIFSFGSPLNQVIEQNSFEYKPKFNPDIDVLILGYGGENEGIKLGGGASLNLRIIDIKNLEEKVKKKNNRTLFDFYGGPNILLHITDNSKFVISPYVGYSIATLSPINEGLSWGSFSIKVTADLVIGKIALGFIYRPLEQLVEDENSRTRETTSYQLNPTYGIRLGVCFGGDN
jgi:hypothetical protein